MVSTNTPVLPDASAATDDRYRAGTLSYTKAGLITLFLWMLWGDFCFTMMEMVIPRLLPIQLERLGASSTLIGLFVGSIPGLMNFFINPIISFNSDRYRGRWGRRIPFLLWPTPFLAVFLILLGYSESIGGMLHQGALGQWLSVSPAVLTIGLIGVLVVCFQFFNMFVNSVYYYLFNDVVPQVFLGRFMALFRVVGTLASFVFYRYVFGWATDHMTTIYVSVALLYLVSFLLMCWRVKEGTYPPPPPTDRPGLWGSIQTYFRECYSHKFYLWFFLGTAIWSMSSAGVTFYVFFATDIGLNLEQFGKVLGWTQLFGALILYPFGILVDRFHPLRMKLVSAVLIVPFNLVFVFWVHDYTSYLIVSLAFVPLNALYLAALLPTMMSLLPRDRYGQFCSAQAMMNSVALILGNVLAGAFLDLMGKDYRYLYVWMFACQLTGLCFLLLVYRDWKRMGGQQHYRPPSVARSEGFELVK